MNRQQFEDALDRYGTNLSRWPDALRESGAPFVAGEPEAAAHLTAALRLDGLLADTMRPVPVDAAFVGRILAGAGPVKPADGRAPTRRLVVLASMAMAVAMIVGFTAGYFDPPDDNEDAIASLIFGASDEDIGDWL